MRTPRLLAALALTLVLGCASTIEFRDAPAQPAATGAAKVKIDENGTAQVRLQVQHLAPPDKLNPPRSGYALWAESGAGRKIFLGRLKVGENLEAEWSGSVPFERFRLLISAEDVPAPKEPSQPYVMATDFLEEDEGWFPWF